MSVLRRLRPARQRMLRPLITAARHWRELGLVACYTGGWVLLTWGIARLTSVEAWIFSGGLFLLSLGGVGLLKDVAVEGLYVLSRTGMRRRG